MGQSRKHWKAQIRFLASEDHWETRECATEKGEQTAGTEEQLSFSVPMLTGLTATEI